MTFTRRMFFLFACLLPAAPGAFAQIFYNNSAPIDSYGSVTGYEGLYNGFSTGSAPAPLTDVKLYLNSSPLLSVPRDGGSPYVTVALYAQSTIVLDADTSRRPPAIASPTGHSARPRTDVGGTVIVGAQLKIIGTIADSAVSTDGGVYDFPVSPGYALAANTKYFIGVTPSNASTIGWAWNDEGQVSGGTDTSGQYHCYGTDTYLSQVECVSNGDDPFLMTVSGSSQASVPAVSPWAFGTLALLMLATPFCLRRRLLRNLGPFKE